VLGREYKGSLLNRSMCGKMPVALRRLRSGLRCACVCQVFAKEFGACQWYTECIKVSFACMMTLSSGKMSRRLKSGAVCAL
jgi:hypothetical protein